MDGKQFRLTEEIMPIIDEIGRHMSRGFFIYRAHEPWGYVYANEASIKVFDCRDREEFKKTTDCNFENIIHPDDYTAVYDSMAEQIAKSDDNQYNVEYRIIRSDGEERWLEECGHYTDTEDTAGSTMPLYRISPSSTSWRDPTRRYGKRSSKPCASRIIPCG